VTCLLLAGAAATSVVALGTGTASASDASTAGYFSNDYVATYYGTEDNPYAGYQQCDEARQYYNRQVYGNPNGAGESYFYCAGAGGGAVNLWSRHWNV
jgi:hypothetical protein